MTITAWVTTDPAALPSGYVELDIVPDGTWNIPGNRVVTAVPVTAEDYGPAIDQADSALRALGYRRAGKWTSTNTAFVAEIVKEET